MSGQKNGINILPENRVRKLLVSKNEAFKREKDLIDDVIPNLNILLSTDIPIVKTEVCLPASSPRSMATIRIDAVCMDSSNNHYVIEFKCPRNGNQLNEMVRALAQVQLYGFMYQTEFNIVPKKVLVLSRTTDYFCTVWQALYPDVDVYVVNKNMIFRLVGVNKTYA